MVPIEVNFGDALIGTQVQESQFDSYRLESEDEWEVVGEEVPSTSHRQGLFLFFVFVLLELLINWLCFTKI